MRSTPGALCKALVVALGMMLAACAGTPAPMTDGALPADIPYKLGKPYLVGGIRYVPRDDRGYDRVGMASWYGREFHGRPTATGRPFDMYEMTAAHPTLPTGTQVKVTNLENGRSVVVVVADRGPFSRKRIIDLSYAAAARLAFVEQGTARVRVTYHRPPNGY